MHRTPPAELDVDAKLVRGLLCRQHPDLAQLRLTKVQSGWDNEMFRLGDELAVRLPRRAVAAALVEKEQRWLPEFAARLPVRIPTPVRVGSADATYPWSWSIVPWIEGVTLSQPLPAHQADVLVDFFRALHAPAPADAPRNSYRGVPLADRAAQIEERLERLARTTPFVTPRVRAAWRRALEAPYEPLEAWIHGDLHPRNVLTAEGRITAVIDWGDCARGDPATDLAAIWMLLDASGRVRVRAKMTEVSAPTWSRARGWAIFFGAVLLETGMNDQDPLFAGVGARALAAED